MALCVFVKGELFDAIDFLTTLTSPLLLSCVTDDDTILSKKRQRDLFTI